MTMKKICWTFTVRQVRIRLHNTCVALFTLQCLAVTIGCTLLLLLLLLLFLSGLARYRFIFLLRRHPWWHGKLGTKRVRLLVSNSSTHITHTIFAITDICHVFLTCGVIVMTTASMWRWCNLHFRVLFKWRLYCWVMESGCLLLWSVHFLRIHSLLLLSLQVRLIIRRGGVNCQNGWLLLRCKIRYITMLMQMKQMMMVMIMMMLMLLQRMKLRLLWFVLLEMMHSIMKCTIDFGSSSIVCLQLLLCLNVRRWQW